MLPAQTPLCHGYRVKRRNHDERPIEPGDEAHGGLERWKQVRNMQAKVTLNSTLWRIKGRPDGLSGVVMRLNTKEPDLTITPFPKPGMAGHFIPSRVWIEDANGTVV